MDAQTQLLEYAERGRSSLPKWALQTPSEAAAPIFGEAEIPQNFLLIIALILHKKPAWLEPFTELV